MAYQINKTDGTVIATVADGQIDTFSTDLTLIGKNYSGYGEAFNENFVKLLENFAGTAQPTQPIRGQMWFDASELKLKVYSGTSFLPVSSATIASTQPNTLGIGDLWFNNVDRQLFFYDGTDTILLGPSYSDSQLLSGLKVESILDSLNQTRVITLLYNNGILLGIFAKDTFTPKNAIEGFSGSIIPGFNAGTLSGMKFNVTCTNSEQLGGVISTQYVRKDTSNEIAGQVTITTDLGITIGSAGQAKISVSSGDVYFSNYSPDKNLIIEARRGSALEKIINIDSTNRIVDFYDGFSSSRVNFAGSVTIDGDLTVNGNSLTINASTLTIEDKNIELAKQDGVIPTDTNADGGGIILEGDTKHVFLWADSAGQSATADLPALAGDAWTSSEHINLKSGKAFKINGTTVLDENNIYVSGFPNVNQLGTQISVTIGPYPGGVADDQLKIENHRISTLQSNYDLELEPDGTGNVALIGNPKITGLADPTNQQDAATKEYVDDVIETRALAFSMDLSDSKPNSYIVTNILNNLAPPADFRENTIARILCTINSNSTTNVELNSLVSTGTATFNTPTGTAPAVTSVTIATASVPGAGISTTRIIKTFRLISAQWVFIADTLLPP